MNFQFSLLLSLLLALPHLSEARNQPAASSCASARELLSSNTWQNCVSTKKVNGQPAQYEKMNLFKFKSQKATSIEDGQQIVFFNFAFSSRGGFASSLNFAGYNGSSVHCADNEVTYTRGTIIRTQVKMDQQRLFLRTQIPGAELSIVCKPANAGESL